MDYLNAFSGFPGKSRITKVQNFKSLRNNALPEQLDGIEKGPPPPPKITLFRENILDHHNIKNAQQVYSTIHIESLIYEYH